MLPVQEIASFLCNVLFADNRVPAVKLRHVYGGTVDNLVEKGLGKVVGFLTVFYIEADLCFLPLVRQTLAEHGKIRVADDKTSKQAVVMQGVQRLQDKVFFRQIVRHQTGLRSEAQSALLHIQYTSQLAGTQVQMFASQDLIAGCRQEQLRRHLFPIFRVPGGSHRTIHFHMVLSIHCQTYHGRGGKVCDAYAVLFRHGPHFILQREILVCPEVINVVCRTGVVADYGPSTHHGGVEAAEVRPRNQEGHDQHIPHCLTALKAHLTGGDEIFVELLFAVPAVDHRMEQNHIKADQHGEVKQSFNPPRRVPVEARYKESGYQVTAPAAQYQQRDSCETIPARHVPDGFGLMGLLHASQNKHHDDHEDGKGQGQRVGIGCKRQTHFLRIHHAKPENLP